MRQLRKGINMPTTTDELYEVAAEAMLSRASRKVSKEASALLQATFFAAHAEQQRIVTDAHLHSAAKRLGKNSSEKKMKAAMGELKSLVLDDQLPLVRLMSKRAEPLQMQAFHLSFQEFYAMRELCGAPLERHLIELRVVDECCAHGRADRNLQEQEERADDRSKRRWDVDRHGVSAPTLPVACFGRPRRRGVAAAHHRGARDAARRRRAASGRRGGAGHV